MSGQQKTKMHKSIKDIDREFFPTRLEEGEKEVGEEPAVFGRRLAQRLLEMAAERLQKSVGS